MKSSLLCLPGEWIGLTASCQRFFLGGPEMAYIDWRPSPCLENIYHWYFGVGDFLGWPGIHWSSLLVWCRKYFWSVCWLLVRSICDFPWVAHTPWWWWVIDDEWYVMSDDHSEITQRTCRSTPISLGCERYFHLWYYLINAIFRCDSISCPTPVSEWVSEWVIDSLYWR